jgi:hypothetical protein
LEGERRALQGGDGARLASWARGLRAVEEDVGHPTGGPGGGGWAACAPALEHALGAGGCWWAEGEGGAGEVEAGALASGP